MTVIFFNEWSFVQPIGIQQRKENSTTFCQLIALKRTTFRTFALHCLSRCMMDDLVENPFKRFFSAISRTDSQNWLTYNYQSGPDCYEVIRLFPFLHQIKA